MKAAVGGALNPTNFIQAATSIGQKFLAPDGTLSKDIMPDLLHPSEKGYVIWAEAIKPTLAMMMK